MNILSRLLSRPSKPQFLWGVFLIGLFIRVAIVFAFGKTDHPQMWEHGDIAHNLYSGHGYTMHWPYESFDSARVSLMNQPPQHEGAFIPPLNPYIIYASYLIFGETPTAKISLMLFYALCSALVIPVVYHTSVLLTNKIGARFSALIALLFIPAAYTATTFSGSTLYHIFAALIVFYAIRILQESRLSDALLLGLCSGLMVMVRSEFFALSFILISFVILFSKTKYPVLHKTKALLLSIGICALVITPWTVRNYKLFDRFVPVLSHPWFEIWRGNNSVVASGTLFTKETYSWVNPRENPELIKQMDAIPYDQFFEVRVNDLFHAEALNFISSSPQDFLFLGAKKLLFLFTIDFPDQTVRNPVYILSMLTVIALSIFGLLKILTSKFRRIEGVFFLLFFGYYLTLTVMTFSLPRYQIYVFGAMIPLVALVFDSIAKDQNQKLKGVQYV